MKRLGLFLAVSFVAGCGGNGSTDDGALDGGHHPDAAPPPPAKVCDNAELEKGCVAGLCKVTGTGNPLSAAGTLTVTQKPVPAGLAGDALGSYLCSVDVSAHVTSVAGLTLSMAEKAPPTSAVLFRYAASNLSEVVPASQSAGSAVVGLVTAPGEFGATHAPGTWSPNGNGGVSVLSSGDEASLLLNLSSQNTYGAYYDGTHLFVCNGPRLLIYKGVPASPAVPPSVVLGQPDLDTIQSENTSSLFGGQYGFCSVWSDGHRLAVLQGSRVLIWEAIPTENQTPADLVLGQPDFSSDKLNIGGISASSLNEPAQIDSNGSDFVVADWLNSRVLVWQSFPSTIGQPATFVVGQPDFSSNAPFAGAISINRAEGVALSSNGMFVSGYNGPGLVHVPAVTGNNPTSDFTVLPYDTSFDPSPSVLASGGNVVLTPSGGLAAADSFLPRIAMMKTVPTGPASIDFVLGQPALDYVVENPLSASVVQSQSNFPPVLGAGKLVTVADDARLLLYTSQPAYNFAPASSVVGQAGLTTNGPVDYRGISGSTLADPADIASAAGILAVADEGNSRVLLFKASDVALGKLAAAVVVGQPDATSYNANLGKSIPGAAGLSGPSGVALDGTHLIVADTENHRILIWNAVPTASGTAANLVLGQSDFTGKLPNHGNGDVNGDGFSDADGMGFFYPTGVASNGTNLFVADRVNHRVLVWNTFPTQNGQTADAVIGQPDFTSVQANANGGAYTVVPNGFNLPTGITLIGTSLWVADTENNRAVRWDGVTSSPVPGAFVGQATGGAVTNPNYPGFGQARTGLPTTPATTTGSVLRPRAIAIVGDQVYVSEIDSNRVHMFGATSLAPVGELGQTVDSGSTANANGVTAASLSNPRGLVSDGTHLWVADSGNHRVLGYSVTTDPTTGASASIAMGQLTFVTNGFNQASTAAGGVTSLPRGLSVADGQLYVADSGNHRVLVFPSPLSAGELPSKVFGQPNGTLALSNSGGAPSASTLSGPRGVFSDGTHVFIADTENNRVLVYETGSSSASLVLGQSTFTAVAANAGGASASTMQEPSGIYFDGVRLWVADTGNHRVLLWNELPKTKGQPADVVIGQPNFGSVLPNQGGSAASATTMAFPADIRSSGGVVYIADSGNNRVTSYSSVPKTNGARADGVLGQPNLASRIAANSPVDLTTLAGPVGLAVDAENLYVVDRDLARALVYHLGTLRSGAPAFLSLSSAGGLLLSGPGGVAAESTPYFNSRVYLSNTGSNEVAIVSGVTRLVSP
jgi:NHL repeat